MLRIVSATPYDRMVFQRYMLLGRSLHKLASRAGIACDVAYDNSSGLPDVYNAALAKCDDADFVLFVHHDVWLDDWFLPERLIDALSQFDVVGVAGNRRRVPGQTTWITINTQTWEWDREYISGSITHLHEFKEMITHYGDTPSPVKLLDGVFLAAKVERLRQAGVTFDPRFDFHFYDLDLCRTCEQMGLQMGTWPIAITHAGKGAYGSEPWKQASHKYLEKWKE
jgi:GT2 family glycosyltransferase